VPINECTNGRDVRFDAEDERQRRRILQRLRRSSEDESMQHLRRKKDSSARKVARGLLDKNQQQTIRNRNTNARRDARRNLDERQQSQIRQIDAQAHRNRTASSNPRVEPWWDRVAVLNSLEVPQPLNLRWNRKCKHCGIEARTYSHQKNINIYPRPTGINQRKIAPELLRLRSKSHPLAAPTSHVSR